MIEPLLIDKLVSVEEAIRVSPFELRLQPIFLLFQHNHRVQISYPHPSNLN